MKKTCPKCRIEKLLSDFSKNRRLADGHNRVCRECHKEYTSQHYLENKKYYRDKAARSSLEYRIEVASFLNWLKDQPCADCYNRYPPVCMDFDHVCGEKKFALSTAGKFWKTADLVMEEVQKCEVVCANCHRLRTSIRKQESGPIV